MAITEFWKLVLVVALAVPMGAWPDEISAVKTAESRLVQSEVAIKVRGRLFDALRIHQGDSFEDASKVDMGAFLNEVSSLTNKVERDAIFAEFTDHLFSFDPSKLDYERQKNAIGDTWHISFLLRCAITDVTDKERWEIRLKALAWVRQQIERIENNEPEDKRTWPEKWGKVYVNENREHNQWERIKKPVRKELTSYIKRCATDIEEDKYSNEFREWAKSEMEKIIGRPLTDDDLWSIGIEWREERKMRAHDEEVHKPYDGGDVLPHPFTFLGYTLGNMYELSRPFNKSTYGDVILKWFKNFRIEPYFGKEWMMLSLAPRSKIAYSAEVLWSGQNTREELFAFAKDIRADIEKRLGVKLGEFFFEDYTHVCDEATWWKANWVCARSRSVFGPILIELEIVDQPGNCFPSRLLRLVVTDKAAEALVEKERKENPLTFDSKAEEAAERRRFERLKELNRQRKAMKDAQKQPQP